MYAREYENQVSGGIFLVGLALLFLTGYWWPGIMFVIGASAIARGVAAGQPWYTVQGGIWAIGIGIIFALGFSLPLLLIVIGLSMIFGYKAWPCCGADETGAPKRKNETVY